MLNQYFQTSYLHIGDLKKDDTLIYVRTELNKV